MPKNPYTGAAKRKLTATTPHGVFTRTTDHGYRFVLVGINRLGQAVGALRWSHDRKAAENGRRQFEAGGYRVEIHPVDGTEEEQA